MGQMLVYHGSFKNIETPKILESKYAKDFGPGFYCTVLREQAERWAKRYEKPVLNTYSVTISDSLKVLEFKTMTEEWLDFIVHCRKGKPHTFDIVIGAMANDQVFNYISDFMDGILTREQFWSLAKFKYPTHQINFCTENSLSCLTFHTSEELSV
jgi:hypothetical protein